MGNFKLAMEKKPANHQWPLIGERLCGNQCGGIFQFARVLRRLILQSQVPSVTGRIGSSTLPLFQICLNHILQTKISQKTRDATLVLSRPRIGEVSGSVECHGTVQTKNTLSQTNTLLVGKCVAWVVSIVSKWSVTLFNVLVFAGRAEPKQPGQQPGRSIIRGESPRVRKASWCNRRRVVGVRVGNWGLGLD